MHISGIAINADAGRIDGQFEILRQEFDYYQKKGFTHVEIAPHGMGVIYNGKLRRSRMNELRAALSVYPFKYVVHGPNPLNLMNEEDFETEWSMFEESLRFTAEVGASVMVYHAGRYLPEESFSLPRLKKLTDAEKERMWNIEAMALREMGDIAVGYGVTIGVENARPYLDASPYCYGESLEELTAMVKEVNHTQVGITLDIGHAYLASCFYKYDLLAGIEAAAPYIRHIHLHDNFGKSCSSFEKKQYEAAATGRGDMHLPPGWGNIPAGDVLERLVNYRGVVTLEMRPRYRAYYGEALRYAQELLAVYTASQPAAAAASG